MTLFEGNPQLDWWLVKQRNNPEWVQMVDDAIEMARVNREENDG